MAAARAARCAIRIIRLGIALSADARIADARRIDAGGNKRRAQRVEHANVALPFDARCTELGAERIGDILADLEVAGVDVRADVNVVAAQVRAHLIGAARAIGLRKALGRQHGDVADDAAPARMSHDEAPCWRHDDDRCAVGEAQQRRDARNGYRQRVGPCLRALLRGMIDAGLSSEERQRGIYFAADLDEIRAILGR